MTFFPVSSITLTRNEFAPLGALSCCKTTTLVIPTIIIATKAIAVILLFGILLSRLHLIVDGLSILRIFKTFRKGTEIKLFNRKTKTPLKNNVPFPFLEGQRQKIFCSLLDNSQDGVESGQIE